jgi:anaerobic selenocysteine-containing dehydrogenase
MKESPMTDAPTPARRPTACILCECNCGILVQLGGPDGRRFERVHGDKAHPGSRGYMCEKALRLDHYQNGRDRLTAPLRKRADGTFEEVSWETAIREVAERFAKVRDEHGGASIFYYGGGGQGNHLPGGYGRSTRATLGSAYRSNALAQEKTGELWVASQMTGCFTRGDFEHCEVGVFIGKNPWFSHGIPRARVTLREMSRDPKRCLVVIDPRRTETAELADVHLQVKPGTDAWLLAAMIAVLVQEDLLAREWLAAHTDGLADVLPYFERVDVARYAEACGVEEEQIRATVRRIAEAESAAFFEDLGVQMNRHSTLVSYLHRLLCFGTGNFGKKGATYSPAALQPLANVARGKDRRSPVTGSRIIGGLVPCNVIPDEILTEHPKRFRAMLVESANPAHSLADTARMKEAIGALDFVVTIDVAMTETARLSDYVLPVSTQYEKAEATFFNFDFPENYFHLRRPLLAPPEGLFSEAELHARLVEQLGAMPTEAVGALRAAWDEGRAAFRMKFVECLGTVPDFMAVAPVVLFRAIGDKLPHGLAEGAVLWALTQLAAQRSAASIRRAGIEASDEELGDALFDAVIAGESGIMFSKDDWDESAKRIETDSGRIQLALPELLPELAHLEGGAEASTTDAFPFVLTAGERRSFTANTIFREPAWRRKDADGALRISPADAARIGVEEGGRVRVTTKRGSVEVPVEISDRMQAGHVSLPNGMGTDATDDTGAVVRSGVALNELTASEDRDPFAGTPWHKHVPARLEAL